MGRTKKPTKRQEIMMALAKTPLDEDFKFLLKNDVEGAKKFVQGIRTELSRARDRIRKKGGRPTDFKLITISIEKAKDKPGYTRVILRRTLGPNDINEYMKDFYDSMTEGPKVNVS